MSDSVSAGSRGRGGSLEVLLSLTQTNTPGWWGYQGKSNIHFVIWTLSNLHVVLSEGLEALGFKYILTTKH